MGIACRRVIGSTVSAQAPRWFGRSSVASICLGPCRSRRWPRWARLNAPHDAIRVHHKVADCRAEGTFRRRRSSSSRCTGCSASRRRPRPTRPARSTPEEEVTTASGTPILVSEGTSTRLHRASNLEERWLQQLIHQTSDVSAHGAVPTLAQTPRNPVFIGELVIPKEPQRVGKRLAERLAEKARMRRPPTAWCQQPP